MIRPHRWNRDFAPADYHRYPLVRGEFNEKGYVDMGGEARVAHMAVGLVDSDLGSDFNHNGDLHGPDAVMITWYYVGKIPLL